MSRKRAIYAVYKGDKFLCEGTREEICEILNITKATFKYYRTKHWIYNRRTPNSNNRKIIIRIDQEDKMEKWLQEK